MILVLWSAAFTLTVLLWSSMSIAAHIVVLCMAALAGASWLPKSSR